MADLDEWLLEERARRTRAVCDEIESNGDVSTRRVGEIADQLWNWLDERFPREAGTRTSGGLDSMAVATHQRDLARELYAAAAVCDSLSVYYSADTFREMEEDAENVRHDLSTWRQAAKRRHDSSPGQEQPR